MNLDENSRESTTKEIFYMLGTMTIEGKHSWHDCRYFIFVLEDNEAVNKTYQKWSNRLLTRI